MVTIRDHMEGRCTLAQPHYHFPLWVVLPDRIIPWLLTEFTRPDRIVRHLS